MTRCLVLLFSLCLPWVALAQPAPADSPAQIALDAWLDAFNANDRGQLEAFGQRYSHAVDVDDSLRFRDRTGGFRLVRREPAEAGTAQALLQERTSDRFARLQVTLRTGEPLQVSIAPVSPPPELRVSRMAQAAALDALVADADAAAANDAFAGVLLVAQGDTVLLQRAWGQADRAAAVPATLETRFRIGSANKMFTAVATLQLVQAGRLSLDGTLGTYLPDYPNADIAKVTIRQLLSHTGGTGNIFGPEFERQRLVLRSHHDYVQLYGKRPPTHAAGERQEYSNYGFVLLGAIIEAVSGQSYYDYIDQHIFAVAGMRASGSLPENAAMPDRARPYQRKEGGWTDAEQTLPWRGTAAGGGYSTAGDLLKFAQALQSGRLLSPALLAEATHPQSARYGYGFTVGEIDGVAFYGHGGGAPGMNADLRVFPTLGRVVIGLSNLDPPAAQRQTNFYLARMPLPALEAAAQAAR